MACVAVCCEFIPPTAHHTHTLNVNAAAPQPVTGASVHDANLPVATAAATPTSSITISRVREPEDRHPLFT